MCAKETKTAVAYFCYNLGYCVTSIHARDNFAKCPSYIFFTAVPACLPRIPNDLQSLVDVVIIHELD